MNILGTTGQERRAWLDRQGDRAGNALAYVLGPTGIPDRLNALAGALQYTDAGDYVEAADASRALWNDPSLANAARYTAAGAAMALPFIGSRGVNELSNNAIDWLADEDGAIRAWHGSPHDFDRFSMDKIGTGEGAQAYGHGLYFAENRAVGEGYRDQLAPRVGAEFVFADGSKFTPDADQAIALQGAMKDGNIDNWVDWSPDDLADPRVAEIAELLRSRGAPISKSAQPGRLYEVNIDANPEDFLDWDAPLSAQGPRVRSVLEQINPRNNIPPDDNPFGLNFAAARANEFPENPVGGDFIKQLPDISGESAEDALRQAGIPGIRYLDAGSRGAGDGSRNYVVFDDSIISILNKYGVAAGAFGLGGLAMQGEEQN